MLITFDSLIYIAAALLPALVLLRYIYRHDRVESESPRLLLSLIGVGVLAAVPAVILETICDELVMANLGITNEVVYFIIYATMIGLVEEGCKYYFLHKMTWDHPEFNYLFDGVVYAVFVSLGFAGIENILYVFQYGLSVAVLRAVLAVPGHMGFAVFMGVFYGLAKLAYVQGNEKLKKTYLILAYVASVALHAFYDACAMIDTTFSAVLFIVFVVAMYVIVYRLVRNTSRKDISIY